MYAPAQDAQDSSSAARVPARRWRRTACTSPAPCACDVSGSSAPSSPFMTQSTSHVDVAPSEAAASQGLTLVHFSAQRKPFWSHLLASPCLLDWGKVMHPRHPTQCAYVEPKSGRVQAPAASAASPTCPTNT